MFSRSLHSLEFNIVRFYFALVFNLFYPIQHIIEEISVLKNYLRKKNTQDIGYILLISSIFYFKMISFESLGFLNFLYVKFVWKYQILKGLKYFFK